MKKFFARDTIFVGVVAVLASELLFGLALGTALVLFNQPLEGNLRWFGLCFVPPVLVLRFYAKNRNQGLTTKSIIVSLFVTFIVFIWFFLKNDGLND
ncbi:MAG: hypothetical protein SPJ13_08585 [Bacteroidales bacterium]|nr:hypothetical protein [Bacteroidales bacterium]